MNQVHRAARLDQQVRKQRIGFIDADIDTAMTFLRIADTALSMGHMEHLNTIMEKAHVARQTVGEFLEKVEDRSERRRLRRKYQELQDAIRKVEHHKQQHNSSAE